MPLRLGIIGCGKMAYALTKGLRNQKQISFDTISISDINPARVKLFKQEFAAEQKEPQELVNNSDVIILAVKPHQIMPVIINNGDYWSADKLVVSIAAGITTAGIEGQMSVKAPVVRVMPNTPCLVGRGIAAIAGGRYSTEQNVKLVQQMFDSVGTSVVVEEKLMDAVTAVSGSGPAYVYLIVEAMVHAGIQVGLDSNLARNLVINTMQGSLSMMEERGEHPAVLLEEVCSPGGTTIAGIRQLEENGIRRAFFQAIEKAYLKSIELGRDK